MTSPSWVVSTSACDERASCAGIQEGFDPAFRNLGWVGPFEGSRHSNMIKGRQKVQIPNPHHRKGDIGVHLLRRILSRAGISRSDWLGS